MHSNKVIAVDFDGVIHGYSRGWENGTLYDPPVNHALESLLALQNAGFTVVIFTTRENAREIRDWIQRWAPPLLAQQLAEIAITNVKMPAIAYIDDRAIRFTRWSDVLKYFI